MMSPCGAGQTQTNRCTQLFADHGMPNLFVGGCCAGRRNLAGDPLSFSGSRDPVRIAPSFATMGAVSTRCLALCRRKVRIANRKAPRR
jgi:hypothetical protein